MPNYSYRCCKCKQVTEMFLPISTDPSKIQNCDCGYTMSRIITGSASFKGFKVFAGDWFKKQYGHEMGERATTRAEFQRDLKKAEEKHKRETE